MSTSNSLVGLAILCAFDIASIVIGALYLGERTCITSLIEFNGATWLLAGGCVVLIVKLLASFPYIRRIPSEGVVVFQEETYPNYVYILLGLCALFMFAWAVVGIIMLATAPVCKSLMPVFVMMIIYVIVLLLGIGMKYRGYHRRIV